jgi:hypothetical protein
MSRKVAPNEPGDQTPRPLGPSENEKGPLKPLSIGICPSEMNENPTSEKDLSLERQESKPMMSTILKTRFLQKAGLKIQELLIHKFESKIDQSAPEPQENKVVRPKDKIDKLDV